MPTKEKAGWIMLNTRPEHGLREKADELAALLSEEKGVRVVRPDALRVAIEEAIARRKEATRGKKRRPA